MWSIDQIRAARASMRFAKMVLSNYWPDCYDMDGASIQEMGEQSGVMVKTKYDPVAHGESMYDAEPGDDWFIMHPGLK